MQLMKGCSKKERRVEHWVSINISEQRRPPPPRVMFEPVLYFPPLDNEGLIIFPFKYHFLLPFTPASPQLDPSGSRIWIAIVVTWLASLNTLTLYTKFILSKPLFCLWSPVIIRPPLLTLCNSLTHLTVSSYLMLSTIGYWKLKSEQVGKFPDILQL